MIANVINNNDISKVPTDYHVKDFIVVVIASKILDTNWLVLYIILHKVHRN